MVSAERRWSSSSNHSESTKFPDLEHSPASRERLSIPGEDLKGGTYNRRTSSPNAFPRANGVLHSERWQARKDNHMSSSSGQVNVAGPRHTRQKSLTDAIRTIRARKGSVGANAHEIAEALKAPVSVRLIVWIL